MWTKIRNFFVKEEKPEPKESKEPKLVKLGNIEELFDNLSDLKVAKGKHCPQINEATRICVCVDCPKKDEGKCWPEKLCRLSGCDEGPQSHFVASCSLRAEATSASPLFGKEVTEDWAHYLKRKYLKR